MGIEIFPLGPPPLLAISLLFRLHLCNLKMGKENTTMATRKSLLILSAIIMLSIWIFGSAIQAEAETMKCKVSGNVVKREVMPIPDVECH